MKKILSLLLGTALILSACQSQNTDNVQEESSLDKKVYVAVENDNEVAVVDPTSGIVLKRVEVDSISHSHGIAVAIDDPSKLYIATHEGLLVLENEKNLYRIGSTTHDLMGFTVNSKDPLTFYASGHPSFGGNSGFQKTIDGGETWNKLSDGIDGPVDFHAMTVSPVNADIVYGYFYSKIQKSIDGGKTWSLLASQPESIFSLVADRVDDQTLYANTKQGTWVSTDGGETWTMLSNDLASSAVLTLVQNPQDANQMLSFSDTFGLASSIDAGKTWISVPEAPNAIFYFMTYSPTDPKIVYAIDENNKIYKSDNSGLNWGEIY